MGNLGYLLRDWLERIFSVEIIRSRNVFHLKGVFTRYRNQLFDGVMILRGETYTPPCQTTANTDGYDKLHEQMNPLSIDIKCVWYTIIRRNIILVYEPVMIGNVDRMWWVATIETLYIMIMLTLGYGLVNSLVSLKNYQRWDIEDSVVATH